MAVLTWDDTGKKLYETGVSKGVLYIPTNGVYNNGVAWNGLVSVTESPSGAEPNAQYADNSKYLNIFSAEEFAATLEAFTYPDEFQVFDGQNNPAAGIAVGQQSRGSFGLCYRTEIGSDSVATGGDAYKLHLMYGCKASPSEKAYSTINDSPEGITFSWAISTTPTSVTGLSPTSLIVIDSTKVASAKLDDLETLLYGSASVAPQLPTPDVVISTVETGLTKITSTAPPTYVSSSHVMTVVANAGTTMYLTKYNASGVVTPRAVTTAGAKTALSAGEWWYLELEADSTHYFADGLQTKWQVLYATGDMP